MQHIWKKCRNTFPENLKFVKIFGPTAEEIAKDLNVGNKVCLVTGASSGIGLEITRCLTSIDCNVLMSCRNTYVARNAAKTVCKNYNRLRFYEVNLASLASVQKYIKSLLQSQKSIDIVILNAATFGLPWTMTENGLETTFQVNFLSQYYLLLSIENILAPDARVIFTSSESHRNVELTEGARVFPSIDHLSLSAERYTSIRAYNLSKLCGVLAARYLHYRWLHSQRAVHCAHPGSFVKTGLCRNWWVYEALYTSMLPFSKTVCSELSRIRRIPDHIVPVCARFQGQAASTIVYCATSPALAGQSGFYFKDCERCEASKLGRSTHLSHRIHDLACDVLRQKQFHCNVLRAGASEALESEKDVAEPALSNC